MKRKPNERYVVMGGGRYALSLTTVGGHVEVVEAPMEGGQPNWNNAGLIDPRGMGGPEFCRGIYTILRLLDDLSEEASNWLCIPGIEPLASGHELRVHVSGKFIWRFKPDGSGGSVSPVGPGGSKPAWGEAAADEAVREYEAEARARRGDDE